MQIPDFQKPFFGVLIGLALALASAGLRYAAFTQSEFATGWDSYFYLVQLKSIVETGRMHSPEGSLIYPFLRVFYWITQDYVSALKWGTAFLCGVWTFLMYGIPRTRSMGLLLASWSIFSPQLTYFGAQYPKNLLGIVLFATFLYAADGGRVTADGLRPTANGGRLGAGLYWYGLMGVLLLVNYFGHRMTFGLCVLYGVLQLLWHIQKSTLRGLLNWRQWVFAGVCVMVLLVVSRFVPGLAHYTDLQRLQGTFSMWPQFAPWSFVTTFGLEKVSSFWMFELVVVLLLLVTALYGWLWNKPFRDSLDIPSLLVCLLLLFPFLTWSYVGLSWRFFLILVLLVPLVFRKMVFRRGVWAILIAMAASAEFSWKSYNPILQDPNYALMAFITQRVDARTADSLKPELVIAHNALAEYYTFTTGFDAMPWIPEYTIDSTRLWRIATGVRLETLQYYVGEKHRGMVFPLDGGYVLLRESDWQTAIIRAQKEDDQVFINAANSWRNPHKMRPGWLLRRKQ